MSILLVLSNTKGEVQVSMKRIDPRCRKMKRLVVNLYTFESRDGTMNWSSFSQISHKSMRIMDIYILAAPHVNSIQKL